MKSEKKNKREQKRKETELPQPPVGTDKAQAFDGPPPIIISKINAPSDPPGR